MDGEKKSKKGEFDDIRRMQAEVQEMIERVRQALDAHRAHDGCKPIPHVPRPNLDAEGT